MSQGRKGFLVRGGMRGRPIVVACCELALFLGGIVAIDFAFFGGGRFWGVFFDPFLVPVLLLSVQYGAGMGVTAALAATLVLLTGELPPLSLRQDLYSYWIVIADRPTIWFGAALVLGSITDRRIRGSVRLTDALADSNRQTTVIAAAYDEARQANEDLVLRLNSNRITLSSVCGAVQRIMRNSISEVVENVDELIALAIDARKFSVFLLNDMSLEALRRKGWEVEDEYQHTYSRESVLFEAVIEERRLLCIANPLDEVFLGRDGVLAGPICEPDTGRVLGMLKIEEVDFIRFHAETIDNFRIVAEWLGLALSSASAAKGRRADLYGMLSDGGGHVGTNAASVTDIGVLAPSFVGLEFSVLAIRIYSLNWVDVDMAAVGEGLRRAVGTTLRATERVFDWEGTGAEFFVLLTGTSAESAPLVARKLEPALRECLPSSVQGFSIEIRETPFRSTEDAQPRGLPFGQRVAA